MDILDELNKTIKEKKEDWNYTPKREKSETDALIDQLLKEFSSESKPGEPIRKMKSYSSQYNTRHETAEREEYEHPNSSFPQPTVEEIPEQEQEAIFDTIYDPDKDDGQVSDIANDTDKGEEEFDTIYDPDKDDAEEEFDTIYDPDKDEENEFDTIYEPENEAPQQAYQPKHEAPSRSPEIYDQSREPSYKPPADELPPEDDSTRVFSKEEMRREQERMGLTDDTYDALAGSTGGSNDSNTPVSGGFGDDYYDENDFEKELGKISPESLDKSERDEFEEFIGGEDEDQIRVIKPKEKKKTGRKILRILATAVVAAFTIIGIFSSVIFCLEKLEMMPTEKEEQEESLSDELADVIQPFVMTSVDDFDSAEKISNEQLINLAIWEIVIHGDIKFFKDEETSKIIIPQKQVELAAENLVGETKEIEHKDIAFSGLEIKYESEKEGYILPDNYYVLTNYPEVTGVTEQDGTYAINVNCYRDTPQWMSNKKSNPVKKMTFTLKKTEGHYQVLSAITV